MDPVDYLRAITRRWKIIAACVLVALATGMLLTRGGADPAQTPPSEVYRATTYLLTTEPATGSIRGSSNLETVATLALLGEVPRRVANELGLDGPGAVTSSIQVEPDEATGLLTVTAINRDPRFAELLSDTFATELLDYLRERKLEQVAVIELQIAEIEERIEEAQRAIDDATTEEEIRLATDRRDGLIFEQTFLEQERLSLTSGTGGNPSGFEVIERAEAVRIADDGGIQAPRSRSVRLLIAALVGLILGIVLALLLERFDTKIRTKEAAEKHFGLPVLAEIPVISRRRRRMGGVVTESFPRSHETNSFRLLGAALQFGRRDGLVRGDGDLGPTTILVTSAAPSEGKSTIVANLAATFAEVGKRVTVLCCDFRHPTLHNTFGVEQGPGIAELLDGQEDLTFDALLQETAFERVRVASTGHVPDKPSHLFGSPRMSQMLADARSQADIVLIDTAPVLAASDWTQLLPHVDAVLVVARAGKTDATSAERTAEILRILQAPVVGVALSRLPRAMVRKTGYGDRFIDRTRLERHAAKEAEFGLADDVDVLDVEEFGSGEASEQRHDVTDDARREREPSSTNREKADLDDEADLEDRDSSVADDADGDGSVSRGEGVPHLVRPSAKE